MHPIVVLVLRVELFLLLLGALLLQAAMPTIAAEQAREFPEVAHLAGPYTVLAIAAIASVQVTLLVVWRLLTLIAESELTTRRGLRCLDAITASIAVATALTAGTLLHLLAVVGVGGPGAVLAFLGSTAVGTALVVLLRVVRGAQATAIEDREPAAGPMARA